MKGFRVECQQLGTARTETVARPGECRRIGHATKLHSLKSHNTHEDPRFGGPIPVTVGTFETKVRPLRGFRALPLGGGGGDTMGGVGGGGGGTDTRHETIYNKGFRVKRQVALLQCPGIGTSRTARRKGIVRGAQTVSQRHRLRLKGLSESMQRFRVHPELRLGCYLSVRANQAAMWFRCMLGAFITFVNPVHPSFTLV